MKNTTYTSSSGQSVNLFIPEHHTKICVSLSGGTDSSLSLYLLCSYLREHNRTNTVEVTIRHLIETLRAPYSYDKAAKFIIEEFKKEFPDINFKEHIFEATEVIDKTNPLSFKERTMRQNRAELIAAGVQSFYNGQTSNPPKQVQTELGMLKANGKTIGQSDREPDTLDLSYMYRGIDNNLKWSTDYDTCKILIARPLMVVDKTFVAEYYNKTPLLKCIYPLTYSCVTRHPEMTNNFTQPCKTCWWCKEKKWAFGTYDGGSLE
jgi:hypothetical protein